MIAELTTPAGKTVWARCERNPKMVAGILSLTSAKPEALDTIQLSYDKESLTTASDEVIMRCTFKALHFFHFVDLVRIVHITQPLYNLTTFNCW